MLTPFSYSTTYVLDKSHFSETYDESVPATPARNPYMLSIGLAVLGFLVLSVMPEAAKIGMFIVTLAAVEALTVRFRKTLWLWRQLISKAANNPLTLTISDEGITIDSLHVKSHILWADITSIEKTSRGWLLFTEKGKSYLSDRCLNEEARLYVSEKAKTLATEKP